MASEHQTPNTTSPMARIERCADLQWQMKALCCALAFNVIYSRTFKQGLLDFLDGPPAAPVGRTAAVALVAFLFASYLLPVFGSAAVWLLEQTLGKLCSADSAAFTAFQTQSGRVPLRRAIEAATFQRDRYWTERIEKELAVQARQRVARHERRRRTFALLALLAFDLYSPRSLVGSISKALELTATAEVLGTLYLALALSWCFLVSRDAPSTLGSIYHPALAQDLAARVAAAPRGQAVLIATPPAARPAAAAARPPRHTETMSRRRTS
jgi:hypothetical protein